MAIMQTCCCCGVRQGSIACAIYSIIISVIGGAFFAYMATAMGVAKKALNEAGFGDINNVVDLLLSVYVIALIVLVALIIACVLLIIGVSMDMKSLLIPYLVVQGVHFLWYLYYFSIQIYFLILARDQLALLYIYLGVVILLIPFLIVDVVCVICVVSQYQEYRDGRGSASSQPKAQTTVILQPQATPGQPGAGPGVAYVSNPPQQGLQQGPPPPY